MTQNNGGGQSNGGGSDCGGGVGSSCGSKSSPSDNGGLKKGPWTATEDQILMEYVRKHGEGNWNAVRRNSGLSRCGKSCRLRWANHLRPNLKKGAFSPDEERLILELHAKYGNKWARMATQLPGRTDNEIKNYWNTRVKRRQRQGLPLYPLDISQHSQPTTPTCLTAPTTPTCLTALTTPTCLTAPTTPTFLMTPTPPASPIFHFQQHSTPYHSPLSSPHQLKRSIFPNPLTHMDPNHPFSSNSFTFHRPPPILDTPLRFKHSHTNSGFTLPLYPTAPQSSTGNDMLLSSPQMINSFQFPVSLATTSPMQINIPQFKTSDDIFSCGSVNMPELPSNQLCSSSQFDMGQGRRGNSSGLTLEDLLQEARVSANCEGLSNIANCMALQEDHQKGMSNGYNNLDDPNSAHFLTCADAGQKQKNEMQMPDCVNSTHDDWSKMLHGAPSNMSVPYRCTDKGEISNGQPSTLTDDVGLDMQHIASLFPASKADQGGTPSSCSWDNLPGIC